MGRKTDKHSGLWISQGGRAVAWDEFIERARIAAAKPKRKGPNVTPPSLLIPPEQPPRDKGRQCRFVLKATGKRCRRWSIRGGTLCSKHGGLRQVPEHPATIRALDRIEAVEQDNQASAILRADPDLFAVSEDVRQALEDMGRPRPPSVILEGSRALLEDDGGKAWRRWVASLPPLVRQQRNRKG